MLFLQSIPQVTPLFPENIGEEHALAFKIHQKDPHIIALAKNPAFAQRADHLPTGFFEKRGRSVDLEMCSLTDYAKWMSELLKFLDTSIDQMWESPCVPETKVPFKELVLWTVKGDFFMGPETSGKLCEDFKNETNRASNQSAFFYSLFDKYTKAFQNAQKSGVVRFIGS